MENLLQAVFVILCNILVIILIMELIIGNLGNGFLALVNFMDWIKKRKISLVNQIITALATFRIYLFCLFFTALLISLLYPDLVTTSRTKRVFNNLWTIGNHFSIWLATCLSVFYFLKIANFSNSLFLYLKWRVKKAVSVILLASLVLLFLNILLSNMKINMCNNESERNTSYSFSSPNYAQCERHVLSIHTAFLSVPFGVSLLSCLLLIFSLWRHHKKRQQHAQRCRDASTMAHIRALQSVIAFLLLYTIFILSVVVQVLKFELVNVTLFSLFTQVVYVAFPSFHSCALILGDVKLRQASLSVLWWLRCRPSNVETSDP